MKLFGKKEGTTRGGGGNGSAPNRGLIWGAWLLSTAGFGILLGGVASMQQVRGNIGGVGQLPVRLLAACRSAFLLPTCKLARETRPAAPRAPSR